MTETSVPLISIVAYCRGFCVAFIVAATWVDWIIFDSPPKGLTLAAAVILSPVLAAVFSLMARLYLFSSNYYFTHRLRSRWAIWGGLMGLFSPVLVRWLSSQPTIWGAFITIVSIHILLIVSYWLAFPIHPSQGLKPPFIPESAPQRKQE